MFGGSWGKQSVDELKTVAKKIGLDAGRFNVCLDQSKMKAAVEEDVKAAQAVGASGTPTFFINGTPVVGAQPVENIQKVIDQKLK